MPIVLLMTVFMVAAISVAAAQDANQSYKVGDKVEVRWGGDEKWYKAEVVNVREDGWYLVVYEKDRSNAWYKPDRMRLIAGAAPRQNPNEGKSAENRRAANQPPANTAPPQAAKPSGRYKIGDRVECDITESGKYFEKGTIAAFPEGDKYNGYAPDSGYYYRVKLDRRAAGGTVQIVPCKAIPTALRPLAGGAPYKPETTEIPIGKVTVDENNTLSADRPILDCPVNQQPVRNGSAPNAEVLKKVLRCGLGEKPAEKGLDGAVTIDITALQVGASRPWDRLRDMNGGTPGRTIVYPVKVTYTEKTFYRSQTVVGENWIRIFNFFVNGFGEWQYGSVETIKRPDNKYIPRE